jgi:predicted nucleic acid-binding protein
VTVDEAVLDASVVVRGFTSAGSANELLRDVIRRATFAHAPDLLVAEVANALTIMVRTQRSSLEATQSQLRLLDATPIELHPGMTLAPGALELAATTGLSAYDAFYAVLASALDVPLVTADRRLAAAVPNTLLVA